ncbi:MAG: phage holin family protein [Clostridium celatum]|nr:phage holin family protein [Clostridium celatum]
MDFMNYITENALILIPVLYVLGMFLKALEFIKDKYIPCIILLLGIAFSVAIIGFNVDAIIQGVLVAGATVLGNQLIKQYKKEGEYYDTYSKKDKLL